MSCSNSTAPININPNYKSTCDRLCKFNYEYPQSNLSVLNQGSYLKIGYENSSTPSVIFNNVEMSVNEIRLYRPSLHQYNGNNADAELIIKHIGNGSNVLVCVPISISASKTASSDLLDTILTNTLSKAPNQGESTQININNFTLNDFVPTASFYSYKGTLPYDPCSGSYNYVVFDKRDGAQISTSAYSNLSKLISKQTTEIKQNEFFYNKTGSVEGLNANDLGDGYYLECNPTGEEGEILYSTMPTSGGSTSGSGGVDINTKLKGVSSETWTIIAATGGAIAAIMLILILKKYIR
jgi:carbonic anhydrase